MKYLLAGILINLSVCFYCNGQHILYDTLRIDAIVKAKKDSVASVISLIDCKIQDGVGVHNVYSSRFEPELPFNYIGLDELYVLEILFSFNSDSLNELRKPDDALVINTSAKAKYQYYEYCVLVKKTKSAWRKLNYNDLILIKVSLNNWWNQKKNYSFEEIKNYWRLEQPIKKMGYTWK